MEDPVPYEKDSNFEEIPDGLVTVRPDKLKKLAKRSPELELR
jgi:hypothetical protein